MSQCNLSMTSHKCLCSEKVKCVCPVIDSLLHDPYEAVVKHFDAVYECAGLGDHEENILYLAYLWKNGWVHIDTDGWCLLDNAVTSVRLEDYELSFEVEPENAGGVNLWVTYDYYRLEELGNVSERYYFLVNRGDGYINLKLSLMMDSIYLSKIEFKQ